MLRDVISKTSNRRNQKPLDLRTKNLVHRSGGVFPRQESIQALRQKNFGALDGLGIDLLQRRAQRLRTITFNRFIEVIGNRESQLVAGGQFQNPAGYLLLYRVEFCGFDLPDQSNYRSRQHVVDRRVEKRLRFLFESRSARSEEHTSG